MLSINDLKPGSLVTIEGVPYQVLEVAHQHIGRGSSSVQTKIKHLKTGQVLSRNFKPADMFEESDVEKRPLKFLFQHRGEYTFVEMPPAQQGAAPMSEPRSRREARHDLKSGRQNRFPVTQEIIGNA